MNPLDYIKFGAGFLVGASLALAPAFFYGKSVGRDAERLEAAKNAIERIDQMGKNNANFLKLPSHERCVVFMRDSGLPVNECDKR